MGNIEFAREILFDFWESIIVLLLFTFLNNKKQFIIHNKFKSIIFILLYTFFSYWASNYIAYVFHTLCIIAFMIVVLNFITQVNFYRSAITVVLITILIFVSESFVLLVEMLLLNIHMVHILESPEIGFIHGVVCKLIQSAIAILFYFMNIKINVFNKENNDTPVFSFAILQILMMSIFMASVNFVVSNQTDIVQYNALLFIIYLLYIILCFIDFREREELLKLEYKLNEQKEHVKNMEAIVEIIRREKHDFANHINTLLAICILNKPDALEKIELYIRKLTHNLTSSIRYFNSGNVYIDGLLAVKNNFALENDIHLEVDIEAPLSEADVNDSHLTSIVGNIIDNAFESFRSHPEKSGKVVSFCTYIEDNNYFLSISDNGPMIPEDIREKIFESGFSTKKDEVNKKDHGYGLYIVSKLVHQNHGKVSVFSSEEETEFLIRFNRKKGKNEAINQCDNQRHTA